MINSPQGFGVTRLLHPDLRRPMNNFLQVENRNTGETLRIGRVRDAEGQTTLTIDGSLPPRKNGPPLPMHPIIGKKAW